MLRFSLLWAGRRRLAFSAVAAVAVFGAASLPAKAQFAAPGSVPPAGASPAAEAEPAAAPRPRRRARRVEASSGSDAAIVERTLSLNGSQSRLELERRDGKLVAAKLQLVGVAGDGSGKVCRVDVAASGPITTRELGRESGLARYELPVEGCEMTFSALNGAVLMKGPGHACHFAREACRSDVAGMWGPPAEAVARNAREIEQSRSRADQQVRAHYKALISRAGGREAVKTVAREQAGFTSEREMVCGSYENEVQHGFCHARFTEARSAELAARLGVTNKAEADAPKRERRKPKAQDAAPATGGLSTPSLF